MKKLIILLSLLLLITPTFAVFEDYDIKTTSCFNSTHKLMNYTDSGGTEIFREIEPCPSGCDTNIGTCYDILSENSYLSMINIALFMAVIVCLVIFFLVGQEYSWIKFIMLGLALYLQHYILLSTGTLGERYSGALSSTAIGILSVGGAFGWVVFFIIAMLLIMLIINAFKMVSGNGKN